MNKVAILEMTHALLYGSVLSAAMAFSGPLEAEQTFPFLKADAVRLAYENATAGRKPVPEVVRQAFVAAEDRNFFARPVARSTITATIASWYPEPGSQTSFAVTEAIAEVLSPDEILDRFVYGAFLGQGCVGVDGAAVTYFGKGAADMDLQEAAFLAALIKAPTLWRDANKHDRAMARRNFVLQEMAKAGFVPAQDASVAQTSPLSVRDDLGRCAPDPSRRR